MLCDINIKRQNFESDGYVKFENLLTQSEVANYICLCKDLISGKIETGNNRSDLGADLGASKNVENITQIMWPSDFIPGILDMQYHQGSLILVKELLGDDMEMDFDMIINKAPHTLSLIHI